MCSLEAGDDLQDEGDSGFGLKRAAVSDVLAEGTPLHEFHRDERDACGFRDVEDVDAIGVWDGDRGPSLGEEALAVCGTAQAAVQGFQRDAPPGRSLSGFVDFAGAAAAEEAVDFVGADLVAGLEAGRLIGDESGGDGCGGVCVRSGRACEETVGAGGRFVGDGRGAEGAGGRGHVWERRIARGL